LGEELLASTRGKKNHGVTQVNDGHAPTIVEFPSVTDGCR
jgi:hypothetical protein